MRWWRTSPVRQRPTSALEFSGWIETLLRDVMAASCRLGTIAAGLLRGPAPWCAGQQGEAQTRPGFKPCFRPGAAGKQRPAQWPVLNFC